MVDDHPIVVRGLAAMLTEHGDRVHVVELDSLRDPAEDVDVVLKDAFGLIDDLRDFVRSSRAPVVVFAFTAEKAAVQAALDAGAAGYVFKGVSEERLVAALERVHAGEQVVEVDQEVGQDAFDGGAGDWPGRAEGLTERESEILALICRGLSNQEVAQTLFLSINSIKTYIRSLYRKIGAESRSQAVIWGLDHDFVPRPWRHRP
nr:response regulator transcription factor [Nocardioides flavescens]